MRNNLNLKKKKKAVIQYIFVRRRRKTKPLSSQHLSLQPDLYKGCEENTWRVSRAADGIQMLSAATWTWRIYNFEHAFRKQAQTSKTKKLWRTLGMFSKVFSFCLRLVFFPFYWFISEWGRRAGTPVNQLYKGPINCDSSQSHVLFKVTLMHVKHNRCNPTWA